MESKNKVFVAVVPVIGSGGRLVLKYSPDGYFAGIGDAAMFETPADAQRALKQVSCDSVIFQSPHNIYIFDNPDGACPTKTVASGLRSRRALSPEEIANERKFAGRSNEKPDELFYGLNRAVNLAAEAKAHTEKANAPLPEMEQSLIAEFTERCKFGFSEYGALYLSKRNWGKEMKEEALDGLFYALMAAKTMEKYGDFIKALEEASDDDLSMDACSPDPLKQAAYLVKKYASELEASEKRAAFLKKELAGSQEARASLGRQCRKANDKYIEEHEVALNLRNERFANLSFIDRLKQERDNYKESYEKLRKENLDMRAAMEAALSLGSPRA